MLQKKEMIKAIETAKEIFAEMKLVSFQTDMVMVAVALFNKGSIPIEQDKIISVDDVADIPPIEEIDDDELKEMEKELAEGEETDEEKLHEDTEKDWGDDDDEL